MHILTLATCLLSLTGQPSGTQKDGTPYYFIENSRSPKGTYVLAFEIKGHKKVDWSRLTAGHEREDYFSEMSGYDGIDAKCYVYRRKDMSPVQEVKNITFWPQYRRLEFWGTDWSGDESAFIYTMHVSWYTTKLELIRLNQPSPLDRLDLLPAIRLRLNQHTRRSYPKLGSRPGYYYVFDPTSVKFLTPSRVVITLYLYVPKGGGDWNETVKLGVRIVKAGNTLKAKVESLQQISLHRETERD